MSCFSHPDSETGHVMWTGCNRTGFRNLIEINLRITLILLLSSGQNKCALQRLPHFILTKPWKENTAVIPIICRRTLRHPKIKALSQGDKPLCYGTEFKLIFSLCCSITSKYAYRLRAQKGDKGTKEAGSRSCHRSIIKVARTNNVFKKQRKIAQEIMKEHSRVWLLTVRKINLKDLYKPSWCHCHRACSHQRFDSYGPKSLRTIVPRSHFKRLDMIQCISVFNKAHKSDIQNILINSNSRKII